MIEAVTFLTAVGQAIASMRFYHDGHPAREKAVEQAFQAARDLLDRDHVPLFTFADGEVIHHRTLLHELKEWEWAARFEKAGIQRLELHDTIDAAEFSRFLHDAASRIAGGGTWDNVERQFAPTGIKYGAVELKTAIEGVELIQITTSGMSLSLDREIEAVEWIHEQVAGNHELPLLEAEVVVRSLAVAINRDSQVVLPLLRLKEFDQYTTTHSCNVAVLATAFAEHLGFDQNLARSLGVCGLLHDIGKVRIPHDILVKPGRLERAEREIIEQHPIHGARIIIERERNLDLAAIVSFEHHRWSDGAGYPKRRREFESHIASRIVQICDVFDALCTDRPYRGGLPPDVALAEIEAEAGTHFDETLVHKFAAMIRGCMLRFSSIDEERAGAGVSATVPAQVPPAVAEQAQEAAGPVAAPMHTGETSTGQTEPSGGPEDPDTGASTGTRTDHAADGTDDVPANSDEVPANPDDVQADADDVPAAESADPSTADIGEPPATDSESAGDQAGDDEVPRKSVHLPRWPTDTDG